MLRSIDQENCAERLFSHLEALECQAHSDAGWWRSQAGLSRGMQAANHSSLRRTATSQMCLRILRVSRFAPEGSERYALGQFQTGKVSIAISLEGNYFRGAHTRVNDAHDDVPGKH